MPITGVLWKKVNEVFCGGLYTLFFSSYSYLLFILVFVSLAFPPSRAICYFFYFSFAFESFLLCFQLFFFKLNPHKDFVFIIHSYKHVKVGSPVRCALGQSEERRVKRKSFSWTTLQEILHSTLKVLVLF